MKSILKSLAVAVVIAAACLAPPKVEAQNQYGVIKELLNIGGTNATATATNVGALGHVAATKYDYFTLQVIVGATNASAGTYDIRWSTSADGTNWTTAPAAPGSSGWFSVPLTNTTIPMVWQTNITVNGIGFWRVDWATNASAHHVTQQVIRAWGKPRRDG
jgi:hypothetical protein